MGCHRDPCSRGILTGRQGRRSAPPATRPGKFVERWALCLLVAAASVAFGPSSTNAFNVDLRTAVVHGAAEGAPRARGPNVVQTGSMFGYAVALHLDHRRDGWLLVGAPMTQTSQNGITKGGAVYRCPIDVTQPCQIVPFDRTGNNIKFVSPDNYPKIEEKSNQWFGATVASSARNGVMVGCAPRYVYFSERLDKREPVGRCFVLTTADQVSRDYSPCKEDVDLDTDNKDQKHGLGKAMLGLSAAITHGPRPESYTEGLQAPVVCTVATGQPQTDHWWFQLSPSGFLPSRLEHRPHQCYPSREDGRRMVMGAPGSYYWQGQLFSQDLSNEFNLNQTRQGPLTYDYNYMGYSVSVANFTGSGSQDYVVGEPRAENLLGMIAVYAPNMTLLLNVSGEQLGEYFGAAVAVGDFNGDSFEDVAVGAPLYTEDNTQYETGRVAIYYQTSGRKLGRPPTVVRGSRVTGCRFGLAVSSLGDINRDGFDDLAVGAPYDGEGGHGTVYIFNGDRKGLRTKPSQVIRADSINPFMRTFGFSLSGGYDLDRNAYPDLLIGAYRSDMAVFLRTRPILKVDMKVNIKPEIIDLEDKNCQQGDGTPIVCFSIETCISYSGHKVPGSIVLEVSWILEPDRPLNSRAFYMKVEPKDMREKETRENTTITLSKRRTRCRQSVAYLKPSFRDKLRPIQVEAMFSLVETRLSGDDVTPILDYFIPNTTRGKGEIKKDCGEDKKCIPDLVINAETLTHDYTLGTASTPLEVLVSIENRGEAAYEAYVAMQLPQGTSYVNIYDITSPLSVKCTPGKDDEGEDLTELMICDLGNPLPANSKINFVLRVSAHNITGDSETILFSMVVNSTNPEDPSTIDNNYVEAHVPVKAVVSIRLTGVSYPEQVFFNATFPRHIETEEDIGAELTHLYELRNLGPSSIKSTSVYVYWPNYLDTDLDLLYLHVNPEIIQGQGSCQVLTHPINPKNITVKAPTQVHLDSHVSVNLHQMLESRESRHKREVKAATLPVFSRREADKHVIRKVMCTARSGLLCATIQCDTGSMDVDDNVLIRIRSRVWSRSLVLSPHRALIVTSTAEAQVMAVPYAVTAEEYTIATHQVSTFVAALDAGPEYGRLQVWVIALAISGGFVLLLLLTLLLWKCGFFRRERPEDMEKLKPNGNNAARYYESVPSDEL